MRSDAQERLDAPRVLAEGVYPCSVECNLIKPAFDVRGTWSLREVMRLDHFDQPQEVVVSIKQEEDGTAGVAYLWSDKSSSWGQSGIALSDFVPGGTVESASAQELRASQLPGALLSRIESWLVEQAIKRQSNSEAQ